MRVRAVAPGDLDAVLAMNNAALPAVSELDRPGLDALVGWCSHALAVDGDGELAGFLLALGPGQPYGSENYRWFAARYEEFAYVDRVVVAPRWQRRGVGSLLYGALAEAVGETLVTCEVNLRPPNPGSLAFHVARGFSEVGRQQTEGGSKEVALLACPPDRPDRPVRLPPAPGDASATLGS